MISCTEFIPAYSELFRFLEERGGKSAVNAFWEHLSDNYLTDLRVLASEKGLRGCWEYWHRTLQEEAADFHMELDEDAGELRTEMRHCPSKGRLLEFKHMQPYPDYCQHCEVLYRRVLEPLGFAYSIDLTQCDQARCQVVIRRKK